MSSMFFGNNIYGTLKHWNIFQLKTIWIPKHQFNILYFKLISLTQPGVAHHFVNQLFNWYKIVQFLFIVNPLDYNTNNISYD